MKVTDAPMQNGFWEAEIDTLTGRFGLTVTGYWMLDAGLFVVHVSEDVNMHETRSPLTGM